MTTGSIDAPPRDRPSHDDSIMFADVPALAVGIADPGTDLAQ
jgi:hypothetical protein